MKLGHISAKILTDGHTRIFANQTARVLVTVLWALRCPMPALEAGTLASAVCGDTGPAAQPSLPPSLPFVAVSPSLRGRVAPFIKQRILASHHLKMLQCTVKHHTDIINFACMMWNFVRISASLSALCTNFN